MAEEHVKAQLEQDRQLRAKSYEEFTRRTSGKPTPTQDELDRIMLGEHVLEKEPDGTPEEPNQAPGMSGHRRQIEAKPGGQYQTRQATPQARKEQQ
jgi:hypothetical protein